MRLEVLSKKMSYRQFNLVNLGALDNDIFQIWYFFFLMYEEEMLPSRDYSSQKRKFDSKFNGDDTLPSNLLSTSVWRTLGIFLAVRSCSFS